MSTTTPARPTIASTEHLARLRPMRLRPRTFDRPLTARERQIIDDITRREFIIGGSALTALIAAGCGGEDAESTAGDSAERVVSHLGGTTTFTTIPKRPMAEGNFSEFDALLALGVPIIARGSGNFAVRDGSADPSVDLMPWQIAAGGAEVPFSQSAYGGQTNLEELARLAPDVLFVHHGNFTTTDEEWYQKRSELVPIVVVPPGIDGVRVVADVFDIDTAIVDALVTDADAKLAGFVPSRIPESITAFYFFDDGLFYVASAQHEANDLVLGPLGLPRFTMRGDDGYPPFATISTERALELDADLVIALHDANFEAALGELEASPLFQSIPAVSEGRYVRATPEWTVAFNRPTVLSVDWLVDGLTDLLS